MSSQQPSSGKMPALRLMFAFSAALATAAAFPPSCEAQFDFSEAVSAKIRTYPIKREKGRPLYGKDGMPQPEALDKDRPANLQELPAVPVDENFPGGSIFDALQHYQKQDPLAALAALLALVKNGYLELEIEKPCHIDAIKLQYDHRPTKGFPSFDEAGLGALMGVLADGAKSIDLLRAHDRLLERYNSGLSKNRERDQETMAAVWKMRLAIAMRYSPRLKAPALEGLPLPKAKELFKAEVAKGKPVEGELMIGALHLAVRAKLERREQKPLPASCASPAK